MKIFLGPAGIPITAKGRSTIDGIKRVSELNLNAMEIEFVRGVNMSISLAKQAGKIAKDLDIVLSIHAPYYINLCNPEKVKASQKRILDSCERACYLGAWIVVFHPGYYGVDKDKAFEMVLKACEEMDEKIKKEGWNVKLGLETTGKKSQFGTLDEIIEIHKKIKNCVPVVDFSHIYARNNGKIDFKEVFEKMENLNLSKYHTHFSGIEYTQAGEKNHVPIAHKKPDFKELATHLLKSKLKEITIISESPILEQDSLQMIEIFKDVGCAWKK
ncbi:MAG: TIM barrel protein [Candidatus Aenigmatarchaeota archaeon]